MKLLIDTDPGVDDALAILMAHAHADVVAMTIAAGNVGLRHTVANALKLVEVLDVDTPVHPGCEQPLVLPAADAAFVHGADGFGDTGYDAPQRLASGEHAALAILRLSHEHAGELTLIALGPLTNLALALRLDPTLPGRIKRLLIMGGAVNGRGNTHRVPAEFNIGFDPEAAHVVFSGWPMVELIDWEATMRHGLDYAELEHWLSADTAEAGFYAAISRRTRTWALEHGRKRLLSADALAMAVALDPGIVSEAEERHVGIELAGSLTRGATVVDWDDRMGRPANARIILAVDQARFESLVRSGLDRTTRK
ncbi:nucleoside hydrolase [Dokdonella sp.]|uniref:nucleoside hydrolase n=1 Tax=Dokdonella sp. TaxID=2291710 RepID=UPI0039C87DB2